MGMAQVVDRIEENALKIHQNQSANQMIMMDAIIDKIGKVTDIHSVPKKMSYFLGLWPSKVRHFFGTLCISLLNIGT